MFIYSIHVCNISHTWQCFIRVSAREMSLGFQIDIKGAIDIVKEDSEINCNNQINTLQFPSRHNYAGDFLSLHAHVADNNFHI